MKNVVKGSMSIKEVGEMIKFFEDKWYCKRYNNSVKDEMRIVYKFYGGWYDKRLRKMRDEGMKKVKEIFEKDGWDCKWYDSCCCNGDGCVLCFSFKKKKE